MQTTPAHFFHVAGPAAGSTQRFMRITDYRSFISGLRAALARHPVRLLTYAILPNRWHLVVGSSDPTTTLDLAARVTRTRRGRGERTDFDHAHVDVEQLRDPTMIVARCRDVEREAVHLGLVSRAQDWPWSSASERFLMLERLPLVASPFLVSSLWLDYLNDPGRRPLTCPRPLGHFTKVPGGLSGIPKHRQQRVGLVRRAKQNHADAHVERPEHLGLRHASGLA
jgi:REP element-mobilizing transposase RayT